MNTDQQARFVSILTASAELFDKTLSSGVIDLYWRTLREYDLPAVEKALERAVASGGKFMPRPGEIIELIGGTAADASLLAWSTMLEAIRRVGGNASVVFDDPISMAVIADMGGWIQLSGVSEKDTPFRANEFGVRYRGYKLRGSVTHPCVLHGRFDAHNMPQGLPTDPPVLIGNADKARVVMLSGSDAPRIGINRVEEAANKAVAMIAGKQS